MKKYQPSKIKEFRNEACLTQYELGRELNRFPQQISAWENGVSYPAIRTLEKIAGILGKNPDEFFG